jgi:hypothetical protein
MSQTVTVPGVSGTIALTFTGTANIGLAQQIANSLAAAWHTTLDVVDYTGGPVPAVTPPDTSEELVLNASVSGVVNVPAAAPGVPEYLVLPGNDPNSLTINGNPNLTILGGGSGNISINDSTVVDLGGNDPANTDAVTVTNADSPYMITMRTGTETVVASGSGTIFGGSLTDLINLSGANTGTNNLVVSQGSDTVDAGSGNVTVNNLVGSNHNLDQGFFGALTVDDLGAHDTISSGFGSLVVTAGGTGASISGLGAITVDAAGGSGDTVSYGPGGGTFLSSTASSNDLVFTNFASMSLDASNTTGDTIIGDVGAITVNAGNAASLLVYSGPTIGDPGMDFIGGSGFSTVVGQTGADSVTGGSGQLDFIANAGESVTGTGALGGSTLFGATGSYLDFAGTSGAMLMMGNAGNETLNAAGGTGFDQFYAGATGADSAFGESLIGGNSANSFVAGTGADTFLGGSGTNVYTFVQSALDSSSQHDVIQNFLGGSNDLAFVGGTDTVSATSGTNVTFTLGDGTTIEFVGYNQAQLTGHVFST